MRTEINKETLLKQVGKRVVFRQTGMLVPAVVKEIMLDPHFAVFMEPIDGIVLSSFSIQDPPPKIVSCSSSWPYLSVLENTWSFSVAGCCWRIYLSEAGCDAVVKFYKENINLRPIVKAYKSPVANAYRQEIANEYFKSTFLQRADAVVKKALASTAT